MMAKGTPAYIQSPESTISGTKTIMPPANAAAPVAGKQNAGWYRYKVGDFEVTVVTDGQGSTPLPDSYVTNTPKDTVAKDLAALFRRTTKRSTLTRRSSSIPDPSS